MRFAVICNDASSLLSPPLFGISMMIVHHHNWRSIEVVRNRSLCCMDVAADRSLFAASVTLAVSLHTPKSCNETSSSARGDQRSDKRKVLGIVCDLARGQSCASLSGALQLLLARGLRSRLLPKSGWGRTLLRHRPQIPHSFLEDVGWLHLICPSTALPCTALSHLPPIPARHRRRHREP